MEHVLPQGASASLLSKYTTLTDAIASTRDDTAKLQVKIVSLESRLINDKFQKERMERSILIREEESRKFSTFLHGSSACINNATDDAYPRSMEKTVVRNISGRLQPQKWQEEEKIRQLQLLKHQIASAEGYRKSMQKRFLQSCKEFRRVSRRVRDEVNLEGFHDADVCAIDSTRMRDGDGDGKDTGSIPVSSSSNSSVLYKEELEQEQEKMRQSSDESNRIYRSYNIVLTRKRSYEKRHAERETNLAQQRSQLERVRRDVSVMTSNLNEVERETREMIQMNQGHAKECKLREERKRTNEKYSYYSGDTPRSSYTHNSSCTAMRERSLAVTPSPIDDKSHYNPSDSSNGRKRVVTNPYIKASMASLPPYPSGSEKNTNGDETSFLQRQHPHRTGRIRVDRQFTTDISIDCVSESDEVVIGQTEKESNTSSITEAIRSQEEIDFDCHLNSRKTANETEAGGTYYTHNTEDCDSGEEDDQLLLFIPFKRSSI